MSLPMPRRTSSSVLPSLRSGLVSGIAVAGTGRVRAVYRALARRRDRDPFGISFALDAELAGLSESAGLARPQTGRSR